MFSTYLELGFDHILDINAYDHILFVVALCAIYRISEWKKILVLITAFTIGHCLTLVLAGLDMIQVDARLVEICIPITIIITALLNITDIHKNEKLIKWNYALALLFGLIHGLGFSNYFKALLGRDEHIISVLLPFNLGVELGQIVIIGVVMLLAYVALNLLRLRQKSWNIFVSGAAAGVALMLLIDVLQS